MTNDTSPTSNRHLSLVLLLFVGSGCAALIYETVWFHMLRLVIGATTISIGVLLASFMGGMCVGSLAAPYLTSRTRHPLRVYAALELGIGVAGIALLFLLPVIGQVYSATVGYGSANILLRAMVCTIALLPPTIMMGATLPAVARWMETSRVGISRMGFFYGANIAGAVAGVLLAGFFLLRLYDTHVATYFAAALNLIVTGAALLLAKSAPYTPSAPESKDAVGLARGSRMNVYTVIALSGAVSMGAQVIWTRLLGLLFGATVYTFTIILAVFLIGLGIGSSAGSWAARKLQRPSFALAMCQAGAVLCIGFAALGIIGFIPELKFRIDQNIWNLPTRTTRYFADLCLTAIALLPATILWGASFPLALAAAAREKDDPARLMGRVYAANTLGAIIGSLFFAVAAIPLMGTQNAQRSMAVVAGFAAILMLWTGAQQAGGTGTAPKRGIWTAVTVVAVLLAVSMIGRVPDAMIGYGREVHRWGDSDHYYYRAEGTDASIAVSHSTLGHDNFHISGKVVASNLQIDMRIQRMLGHVPALMHGSPKTVLVVGCGAGVTAGSFTLYPEVERIVICEIEPKVIEAASTYFSEENYNVLKDPRTEIIFDDARHYMVTSREKFDVITSDPIHPWVRGAASLYTEEYFDLCKKHLNPGGVVTQWVPLYETNLAAVKSQVGTFMQSFPYGTAWNSDTTNFGYDIVLTAKIEPTVLNFSQLQARLDSSPAIHESLAEVDLGFLISLFNMYISQGSDLQPWLTNAAINRDRNLRLQYLAGLSLDRQISGVIFKSMAEYRRYPENLFVVPPDIEGPLKRRFQETNDQIAAMNPASY